MRHTNEIKKEEIPLVSVCLPTYNRAHYLPGILDCWLDQTFKNFELIISDDASTDDTEKICEKYAKEDSRIRYFRQEKNLNIPTNHKFIFRQARGKYFIWAADDDLYDKRFLEDCLAVFKRDPELIMVFADMIDIDSRDGKEINHPNPPEYMPLARDAYERLKQFTLFHFNSGKAWLLTGLWKREAVFDEPLFGLWDKDDNPPYYWGQDVFFISRNLAKGPIGFVPQTRFFRRSRAPGEYIPSRPIAPRLLMTFYYRLKKVFGSPYFCYEIRFILGAKQFSLWQRLKLVFWNFYVMARLFFVRKI